MHLTRLETMLCVSHKGVGQPWDSERKRDKEKGKDMGNA